MTVHHLFKYAGLLLLLGRQAFSFSLYPTVDPDKLAVALNISVSCLDALNTTVACDDSLFQWTVTVDDHFWSQDNLTTLCNSACTTSAQNWELDVASACVADDLTVYGKLVPAYTVAGRFTDGLGIACLQSAKSDWCMIESLTWVGSDVIRPDCSVDPTDPSCSDPSNITAQNQRISNLYNDTLLCSDCFMKMFHQRLSSDYLPYSDYSEYLIDQFQDIQDVCSSTVGNLSTRAFYPYPTATIFFANSTTIPTNGTGTTATAITTIASATTSSIITPTPTQTNMVSNCDSFYQAVSGDGCYSIATTHNITLFDFQTWNPDVGANCTGLLAGYFYCIGLTPSPTPTTSSIATPTPTQTGMITNCNSFYDAVSGDSCYTIATTHSITLTDFETWNPAVGTNCTGLFAGYYYCIGIALDETSSSCQMVDTSAGITELNATLACNQLSLQWGVTTGDLIQYTGGQDCYSPNVVCLPPACSLIQVPANSTCNSITSNLASNSTIGNVTTTQLLSWNPNIIGTCDDLLEGQYICSGAPGGSYVPLPNPSGSANAGGQERGGPGGADPTAITGTTVSYLVTSQPLGANPTAAPAPTQVGIAPDCNQYAQAQSGDYCTEFASANKITADELYQWNTVLGAGGANCSSLFFAGYYYCIGVSGSGPATTTSTPPVSTSTPIAPSPTQSGIISNCNLYAQAVSEDYCSKFSADNSITTAELYTWNAVLGANGANCNTEFFAGYYYCIGVSGSGSPTTTASSAPTSTTAAAVPSPTQSGIVSNCNGYAEAVSGDYCYIFASNHGITTTELYDWNTVLGSNGANCGTEFFAGYYYCISTA